MNAQNIQHNREVEKPLWEVIKERRPEIATAIGVVAVFLLGANLLRPTNFFGALTTGFADGRAVEDLKGDISKLEKRFDKFETRLEKFEDRLTASVRELTKTVTETNNAQTRVAERLDAHLREAPLYREPDVREIPRLIRPKPPAPKRQTRVEKPANIQTGMRGE